MLRGVVVDVLIGFGDGVVKSCCWGEGVGSRCCGSGSAHSESVWGGGDGDGSRWCGSGSAHSEPSWCGGVFHAFWGCARRRASRRARNVRCMSCLLVSAGVAFAVVVAALNIYNVCVTFEVCSRSWPGPVYCKL